MSKGGISERLGGFFGGVYEGGGSTEGVRTAVEQADLVLFIGTYPVCSLLLVLRFIYFRSG
jgi:TPP-dependent 2-oxoacid decarboxylase